MKENYGRIMSENPGTPRGGVMKLVGAEYRRRKEEAGGESPVKKRYVYLSVGRLGCGVWFLLTPSVSQWSS